MTLERGSWTEVKETEEREEEAKSKDKVEIGDGGLGRR